MPLKAHGLRLLSLIMFTMILLSYLTGVKAASLPGLSHNEPNSILLGAAPWLALANGPTLQIDDSDSVTPGQMITVPLSYQGHDFAIAAISFSIDIDQTCLAFDTRDADQDGRPDVITFHTPPGINMMVAVDLSDEDGELDIIIADFAPPLVALPDRAPLLEIQLRAVCRPDPGATLTSAVAFSHDPTPSFGSATGGSIPGTAIDGFVTIVGPPLPPTLTPTVTPTPPLVATALPATPTLIPTAPPVTIVDAFAATPADAAVRLSWRTSSEADTAGFYLYRKQIEGVGASHDFHLITTLLPGQGVQGSSYLFVDKDVEDRAAYLYLLVEEKHNGVRTEFIQLIITIRLAEYQPYQFLLPLIVR